MPNSVGGLNSMGGGGPKFPKSNSMGGGNIMGGGLPGVKKISMGGHYRKLGVTSPNKKPYLQ